MGDSLRRALDGADRSAPALEIGAGTGIFSRPLVAGTQYRTYFVTDTSPFFLQGTRSSIDRLDLGKDVRYVVLSGDELHRWPAGTLSLVALRFVLHHVLDWEGFIHSASRLLVPVARWSSRNPARRLPASGRDGRRPAPFAEATAQDAALGPPGSGFLRRHDPLLRPQRRRQVDRRGQARVPGLPVGRGMPRGSGWSRSSIRIKVSTPSSISRPAAARLPWTSRHNLAVNFGFGRETLEFFDRHLAPACDDLKDRRPAWWRSGGQRGGGRRTSRGQAYPPCGRARSLCERSRDGCLSSRLHPEVAARRPPPEGFQLTLDYPPSAELGPRWGQGRRAHGGSCAP